MAANQILIQHGYGYLKLPVDQMNEFYEKLVAYYETNDSSDIKAFVKETAIVQRQLRQYPKQPEISIDMFLNRNTPAEDLNAREAEDEEYSWGD